MYKRYINSMALLIPSLFPLLFIIITTVVNQGLFQLISRHKQQQQQQNQQQQKKTKKKLETIKTASYFAPVSCKPSRAGSFVTSFICEGFGFLGTSGAKPAISWYTINTSLPDTHSTGHWALERNKCNEHYSKTGKGTTQSFIWLLKREVWGIPREC